METMGSVFFHLCCQTCPGWGQDVASDEVSRGGVEADWQLLLGRCPLSRGQRWLDELKLSISAPYHESMN